MCSFHQYLSIAFKRKLKYSKPMAKRGTTLSPKKKSRRSHKTKKRLAIKRAMLAKKNSCKKFK